MKKRTLIAALVAAALVIAGVVFAFAAQGDQSDPLITLSYLEKVVTPKLNEAVDAAVNANSEELDRQLDIAITSYETRVDEKLAASGANFTSRELTRGEKFTPGAGREVLLVSGSATALGKLTDTTTGSTVSEGAALTAGHLYVTHTDASGLTAADGVTVMSR